MFSSKVEKRTKKSNSVRSKLNFILIDHGLETSIKPAKKLSAKK